MGSHFSLRILPALSKNIEGHEVELFPSFSVNDFSRHINRRHSGRDDPL